MRVAPPVPVAPTLPPARIDPLFRPSYIVHVEGLRARPVRRGACRIRGSAKCPPPPPPGPRSTPRSGTSSATVQRVHRGVDRVRHPAVRLGQRAGRQGTRLPPPQGGRPSTPSSPARSSPRSTPSKTQMKALSDEELKGLTPKFRERLKAGETLDDLLPEAFAACREAARRTKNMRHYDVQIVGGVVLHRGNIAEMVTGEGKTLVATLPAYLNALEGKGVHVVTVNDYLARRDCEWMLPIYNALGHHRRLHPVRHGPGGPPPGLRVRHHLRHQQRVRLRLPARQHEARPLRRRRTTTRTTARCSASRSTTPSSTRWTTSSSTRPARRSSSPARRSPTSSRYDKADKIARAADRDGAQGPARAAPPAPSSSRHRGDACRCSAARPDKVDPQNPPPKGVYFEIKEKERTCHLTDAGHPQGRGAGRRRELLHRRQHGVAAPDRQRPEGAPPVPARTSTTWSMRHPREQRAWASSSSTSTPAGHVRPAVVRRAAPGGRGQARRRTACKIKEETQTLATVTLQNFFKLYKKLAGMTGTAMTEANEFWKIYKLDVIAIPTNKPLRRVNQPRPGLPHREGEVGRGRRRDRRGPRDRPADPDRHDRRGQVREALRACSSGAASSTSCSTPSRRTSAREAEIVAQAGRIGAVTISTNMAGRGTDIILGGNPETLAWASSSRHKYPTPRSTCPTTCGRRRSTRSRPRRR